MHGEHLLPATAFNGLRDTTAASGCSRPSHSRCSGRGLGRERLRDGCGVTGK